MTKIVAKHSQNPVDACVVPKSQSEEGVMWWRHLADHFHRQLKSLYWTARL